VHVAHHYSACGRYPCQQAACAIPPSIQKYPFIVLLEVLSHSLPGDGVHVGG